MQYNTIHHDIRNEAGLSILDYCILEILYNLSNSGKERYTSWCNATKDTFKHLASTRTIVNRYNYLEKNGWIVFKGEKRFLKKTTKKYYEEVYSKIRVKKLHGEIVSPVKGLHPKGEEVAPFGVKKLHLKGEEVAPNKNSNKDINNNIDKESVKEKDTHIKKLESESEKLKAEIESLKSKLSEAQRKEKSSAKKESGNHEFPDNRPEKYYVVNEHDKRPAKHLPFDLVTARHTIDSLYPTWEELKEDFEKISRHRPNQDIYEKCLRTFVEDGITKYYTSLRTVDKLKVKLFEWIQKEISFQRNEDIKKQNSFYSRGNNSKDDDTPSYMMT